MHAPLVTTSLIASFIRSLVLTRMQALAWTAFFVTIEDKSMTAGLIFGLRRPEAEVEVEVEAEVDANAISYEWSSACLV